MICAAISERSTESAIDTSVNSASMGADIVEIRFDSMIEMPQDLDLFKKIPVPKIATLRTTSQGGNCNFDEERLDFFKKCSGCFEYIDIEDDSKLSEMQFKDCKKIVSFHDFSKTPSANEIKGIINNLQKKSDIAKAAFYVRSISDLYEIIIASQHLEGRYILIGMGELGEITRICYERLGSEITYASPCIGKETAPGQIDIQSLKKLSKDNCLTGIIGNPVNHSRSPDMHNAAFRSLGINGRYFRFKCEEDELGKIIKIIKILGMRGVNVTIPHKQTIMAYLDELDETSKAAGAVNCIINDGNDLKGVNTDIAGFRESFKAAGASVCGKNSLIIGAGGAARACAAFLSEGHAEIKIINRTKEKAERLAKEFNGTAVDSIDTDFDIIVNCTPMGMEGFDEGTFFQNCIFHKEQTVMDAVPVPEITKFLERAEKCGADVISGREMLIYQALDAFKTWTGCKPNYSIMSKAYGEKR